MVVVVAAPDLGPGQPAERRQATQPLAQSREGVASVERLIMGIHLRVAQCPAQGTQSASQAVVAAADLPRLHRVSRTVLWAGPVLLAALDREGKEVKRQAQEPLIAAAAAAGPG